MQDYLSSHTGHMDLEQANTGLDLAAVGLAGGENNGRDQK